MRSLTIRCDYRPAACGLRAAAQRRRSRATLGLRPGPAWRTNRNKTKERFVAGDLRRCPVFQDSRADPPTKRPPIVVPNRVSAATHKTQAPARQAVSSPRRKSTENKTRKTRRAGPLGRHSSSGQATIGPPEPVGDFALNTRSSGAAACRRSCGTGCWGAVRGTFRWRGCAAVARRRRTPGCPGGR